jgi:hypothetical protein
LLGIAWVSLLGGAGWATEQYWVAPAGNDAAAGSRQQPFRTIMHAVQAAHPGDTVFVQAGRYPEHVAIAAEQGGRPDQWLTIAAAPGDERQAVVGTQQPQVDAYGSTSSAFSLTKANYVRIRGFTCLAAYRGRGSGIAASECEHLEILNCVVTGGGQGGIDANRCDFVTIDGVEAYCNGGGTGWSSGISLFEPKGKQNVIRNCLCVLPHD